MEAVLRKSQGAKIVGLSGKKYNVGYTTGVFDLFHIGHLNILRRAKENCEYLIVGVSTDQLVLEYKQKRPVIEYRERIEIVKSIRYVDQVVAQKNMEKMEAWQQLRFDVMFHGDDWKGSALYKHYQELFSAVGVDIVFLPHTAGTSSTELAKKLCNFNAIVRNEG
ncbi:MAG: adenylyltransferase/cytidyltransferase family protein [Thermincola sp.]|nr:adenylyltransferase/cytidyltransferase family protein [Thermincola sp.]